mgnify:FL=1
MNEKIKPTPPPPLSDYDRGYDMGCDVKDRWAEPCPEWETEEFKLGFVAGLGDRGAYYRKWNL